MGCLSGCLVCAEGAGLINPHKPNYPRSLPVISLLLGSSLWGVLWLPLRYFNVAGLHGAWLILAIYLLLALPAGWWSWKRRGELRGHHWTLIGLLVFGGWTNVAFMLALVHGEVVRILLLFYLSPVWAIFAARIFLREAVGWRGALAAALAVGGPRRRREWRYDRPCQARSFAGSPCLAATGRRSHAKPHDWR